MAQKFTNQFSVNPQYAEEIPVDKPTPNEPILAPNERRPQIHVTHETADVREGDGVELNGGNFVAELVTSDDMDDSPHDGTLSGLKAQRPNSSTLTTTLIITL